MPAGTGTTQSSPVLPCLLVLPPWPPLLLRITPAGLFEWLGAPGDELAGPAPAADLLIVKDVLQHLNDATVQRTLEHFPRFRQVLATNCVNPRGPTMHRDIADGDFRYLDLRQPPFSLQATEVYSFERRGSLKERLLGRPRWRKKVLLVESGVARR